MEATDKNTCNKGGRPKKVLKKNQRITVKCTNLDKATIEGKSKLAELTVSEFLLELGLTGQVDTRQRVIPGPLLDLKASLLPIGNNLNQLTKIFHGKPNLFTAADLEQLQKVLGTLQEVLALIKGYWQ
jgi:hypothetical protein